MPLTAKFEQASALMERVPLLACPAVPDFETLLDKPAVAPNQESPQGRSQVEKNRNSGN